MVLLEELKKQGWYLTEEGIRKLTTTNNIQVEDANKIISLAINWDLKDIAAGALPTKTDSNGTISGPIVLQIQKMRNISAPKANEESAAAPRFLQLELSDGNSTIAALEFERISSLNLNLPPGTKIALKADKLQLLQGFLVLKSSEVQVLGGRVEQLAEKWEVARQMLKYARSNRRTSGPGVPPPWIAFGRRLDAHKDSLPTDRNFKSLQAATEKDKNSKENEEFNASRNQAIAEAAKGGQKKIFGGGQQNILDHNVKKILEKGYTEEEAKHVLKTTNNNLERALYNLKRRNNNRDIIENKTKPVVPLNGGRVREKGGIASAKEEASSAKPQANVCLFDFLTDKLPVSIPTNTNVTLPVSSNNEQNLKDSSKVINNKYKTLPTAANKFENNMSSSFAANRATNTPTQDSRTHSRLNSNSTKNTQVDRKLPFVNKSDVNVARTNTNKMQSQHKNVDKAASQPPSSNLEETKNSNNRKTDRPVKKESDQILKQSSGDFQGNKRNNDYKISESKPCQLRDKNRNNTNNNPSQQKQKYKDNNYEKEFDNLVESTSKMNISQGRNRSQHNLQSGGNQQQMPISKPKLLQQNTPRNYNNKKPFIDSQVFSSKSVPQNPKSVGYIDQPGSGFVYDHSKIVGFQSKEANEYAMNLLKSQGLTMPQIIQPQSPQQVTSLPPPVLTQQQHPSNQILNHPQTPPTIAYMAQNSNMFIAPTQQAPSQFNMMSNVNWPWKIGDLCLAKYWDDGNYYDAKITAVSEKTCVVLFLGYGNHEEVLKSDCLPITDAQHIPMNAYQANVTVPPMQQPPPSSFQQANNIPSGGISSGGGSVSNQRYRGERQMYVPPNKRGNN